MQVKILPTACETTVAIARNRKAILRAKSSIPIPRWRSPPPRSSSSQYCCRYSRAYWPPPIPPNFPRLFRKPLGGKRNFHRNWRASWAGKNATLCFPTRLPAAVKVIILERTRKSRPSKITTLDKRPPIRRHRYLMPHVFLSASLGGWVVRRCAAWRPSARRGFRTGSSTWRSRQPATRSAKDIAIEMEAVGGDLNAYTSREQTAYHARVLQEDRLTGTWPHRRYFDQSHPSRKAN